MMMSLPVSELKSYSLITLTLPGNYSYCICVAIGSMFAVRWESVRLEQVREKYHVPRELLYSADVEEFNHVQAARQNTLEKYPQFMTLLLLGGLDSPVMSAAGGSIVVLGRIASSLGYSKSDTRKNGCCKLKGGCILFEYVGWVMMMASTTKLALRLLQII